MNYGGTASYPAQGTYQPALPRLLPSEDTGGAATLIQLLAQIAARQATAPTADGRGTRC